MSQSTSARRVAALAVRCYGADRAGVGTVCEALPDADAAAMLAALVAHGLLTSSQARDLHHLLDTAADPVAEQIDTGLDWPALPPDPPAVEPIPALGGFRILRRLGEGSMGTVYLGYHEGQDRQAAIKVLADWVATNAVCVERFYLESRNSILLAHPHIVRGYSAGYDGASGKHFLVREFVDGVSAQAALDQFGRLPVGAALQIVLDICAALEYLHVRQFVHRDVKPDNILINRAGVAKLADLGLLHRINDGGARSTMVPGFGTSYYMPHEQAVDARKVDARSDLYALGATLYHLLTGEVPFPGGSHQEIVARKADGQHLPASALNPAVPSELDRILERMLARDPRDRQADVSAAARELAALGLAAPLTSFPALHLLCDQPAADAPARADGHTRPDFGLLHGALAAPAADPRLATWRRGVELVCRTLGPLLWGVGLVSASLTAALAAVVSFR